MKVHEPYSQVIDKEGNLSPLIVDYNKKVQRQTSKTKNKRFTADNIWAHIIEFIPKNPVISRTYSTEHFSQTYIIKTDSAWLVRLCIQLVFEGVAAAVSSARLSLWRRLREHLSDDCTFCVQENIRCKKKRTENDKWRT